MLGPPCLGLLSWGWRRRDGVCRERCGILPIPLCLEHKLSAMSALFVIKTLASVVQGRRGASGSWVPSSPGVPHTESLPLFTLLCFTGELGHWKTSHGKPMAVHTLKHGCRIPTVHGPEEHRMRQPGMCPARASPH